MLRRALAALARFLHTFSGMRRGILALPLLLAACGQPVDGDNHGWGWQHDAQAADGLRVRYADDSTPRVDDIDAVYQAVAACMSVPLPHGPLLIFAPGILATTDVAGIGFLDTGTFVIDSSCIDLAAPGGQFTLRHELVHYLLDQIGFPRDRNQAHDSPYFSACVVP